MKVIEIKEPVNFSIKYPCVAKSKFTKKDYILLSKDKYIVIDPTENRYNKITDVKNIKEEFYYFRPIIEEEKNSYLTTQDMKIGEIGIINEDEKINTMSTKPKYIMKTFDGFVDIENPENTFRKNLFECTLEKILPKETVITLKI